MVSDTYYAKLQAMWSAAGKPSEWAVPISMHQEYERAMMGTTGKYKMLALGDAWMVIDLAPELRLPEGF